MRKYYCDSCEEETDNPNVFEVPCHLYSKKGLSGYSDSLGNNVSGRRDRIDLCNKCWNIAFSGALKAIALGS